MKESLITRFITPDKEYEFFILKNKIIVRYLNKPDTPLVVISDLDIEMVGLMPRKDGWSATIITKAGLQKLKHQVSETLEVIGFDFNDLDTAIKVQHFIVVWMEKLKDKDKDKNKEVIG